MASESHLSNSNPNEHKHIFPYPFEIVIKGLWNKYPSMLIPFVSFHKVIDMKMVNEDIISFKKLMYTRTIMFAWAFTIEDIKIDFKNRVLEMKTTILKSKNKVDSNTIEYIVYKTLPNEPDKTFYSKAFQSGEIVSKFQSKIGISFQLGAKIVTQRCEEIVKLRKD